MDTPEDDVPVPRTFPPTEEVVREIAKDLDLDPTLVSRTQVLMTCLERMRHYAACFGSVAVAVNVDQPKNPLEVVDKLKAILRDRDR